MNDSSTCYVERSRVRRLAIDLGNANLLAEIDKLEIYTAGDFTAPDVPAVPFEWALRPREQAVLRELLTHEHVLAARVTELVNSRSAQAPRKVIFKLRAALRDRVGVELTTVPWCGYGLDAKAKKKVLAAMVRR